MIKHLIFIALVVGFTQSPAQVRKIHSSEIANDWGYHYDADGEMLSGPYRIIMEDGGYTTAFFSNGRVNGFMETYDTEGKLLSRSENLLDDQIVYREYDSKGNIIAEEKYFELEILEGKRGKFGSLENGQVRVLGKLYDSNVTSRVHEIKNGQYHGKSSFLNDQGKILYEKVYHHGEPVRMDVYLPNGKLLESITFTSQVSPEEFDRHIESYTAYQIKTNEKGLSVWTDSLGEPLTGSYLFTDYETSIFKLKKGLQDGLQQTYDSEGMLKAKYETEAGQLHGKRIENTGSRVAISNYRYDTKHGLHFEYNYRKGIVTDSVHYVNGKKEGIEQKRWTNEEEEKAQYPYKNGKINGEVKTYALSPDGNEYLKQVENYMHGAKQGKQTIYDPAGEIILQENYKFDKLHGIAYQKYDDGTSDSSRYVMEKQLSYQEFDSSGRINSEWVIENNVQKTTLYFPSGKVKRIRIDPSYDKLPNKGDTIYSKTFNEKQQLIEEKFEIAGASDYTVNIKKTVIVSYNGKGKVTGKKVLIEDYPNLLVKEYQGNTLIKEYEGPKHPAHGEEQTITYLNDRGEVIKTCVSTYFDESEYDETPGEWREEKCN